MRRSPRPRGSAMLLVAVGLGLLLGGQSASLAAPSEILRQAMEDELERSRNELFLEDLDRPYFIAYTVSDVIERSILASDGALSSSQEQRWRTLQVQVRVGDYRFDNGNFAGPGGGRFGGFALLPLEDDYQELRRQIWLATDAAYKNALSAIAGKRAALQNRIRDEELADFTAEAPFVFEKGSAAPNLDTQGAEALVLALSGALRERPGLLRADVLLLAQSGTTHYLNSEGTFFVRDNPFAGLAVTAGTQAPDGRPVEDHVVAYAHTVAELPPRTELLDALEAMANRIEALRDAPLLERYNGPVLFEGQAAAELFSQGFVPALIARRAPVTGGNGPGRMGGAASGPFQDRLGARVLPRPLRLVDDPTANEIDGQPTPSGHVVDDEGVPAAPTVLVDRGRLKTLLNDRTPTRDIEGSTGNLRNGMVVPSNLLLTSSETLEEAALRAELMALVEESGNEYGLVVTRLFNPALSSGVGRSGGLFFPGGGSGDSALATEAFRIWPDGRRERVRSVRLIGLAPDVFRDIIAVGDRRMVYTAPLALGGSGMGRGMTLGGLANQFRRPAATLAVPDLLFEDFTLRAPDGDNPSLPVIPRPVAATD